MLKLPFSEEDLCLGFVLLLYMKSELVFENFILISYVNFRSAAISNASAHLSTVTAWIVRQNSALGNHL